MNRRNFLKATTTGALAAAASTPAVASPSAASSSRGAQEPKPKFRLKYAPHFGMFKHSAGGDLIDQLEFMSAEGFTALEDNGMRNRSIDDQERVAEAMKRLGMEMGVFVAHAEFNKPSFATSDPAAIESMLAQMQTAVEVAERVNARWCTVVPGGFRKDLEWDYQTALVIDNLRRACEILEPARLTMVLEPLNPWVNHPGCFLTKVAQAYLICRAVDSPSCKVLDDLYHQQITEGNLIGNIDLAWDEIGYFQTGDHPGRKEPTTGEINYLRVFGHIASKGYEGIIGMEHGNSRGGEEGERAVIDAYRAVDQF